MTISIVALALITLAVLLWRGGGGRFAIVVAALAGSVTGGLVAILGGALFGGLAHVGQAILGAFGG